MPGGNYIFTMNMLNNVYFFTISMSVLNLDINLRSCPPSSGQYYVLYITFKTLDEGWSYIQACKHNVCWTFLSAPGGQIVLNHNIHAYDWYLIFLMSLIAKCIANPNAGWAILNTWVWLNFTSYFNSQINTTNSDGFVKT